MLKRKILACLVALSLVIGTIGLPTLAIAEDSVSQTDTATVSANKPEYVPVLPTGIRPCPTDDNSAVAVDVDENVGVLVDNKATATTGLGSASGTQVTNRVGGDSKAVALGPSGQPVEQSENGALGDNNVKKVIDNSGNANASTGLAFSNNNMDNNTAEISSNKVVDIEIVGELIDSDVEVNATFNYWAAITGLAEATTGNSNAGGLFANSTIDSNDKAVAKGATSPSTNGGSFDGSALATNGSDNVVGNQGLASAATGKANAGNEMKENNIEISPTVKILLSVCGDIVNSDVTVNLIYNFWATISGIATAVTGESAAVGAIVDNDIDNLTSSKAIGDAPALTGGNGSHSDGSAISTNDTNNNISNAGRGVSLSGDAAALNEMIDNDIIISPSIKSAVEILETIVDSKVVINVVYNFWASIFGEAGATTGDAEAAGLEASNEIDNSSEATAIGDSVDQYASGGMDKISGEAIATNDTNNLISNIGAAVSASGDASALNKMADNTINLSPFIATVVMIVHPIVGDVVTVDIVYDIWAKLAGMADASTGNAISAGTLSVSSISSRSDATAIARVDVGEPEGTAVAVNSSDNKIGNEGIAGALTGKARAISFTANSDISLIGCFEEDLVVDGTVDDLMRSIIVKAEMQENVRASTGNAVALGNQTESVMKSRAVSLDIFGSEPITRNESDDDIDNKGKAVAASGNAFAESGKSPFGNTENVILIGFSDNVDTDADINKAFNPVGDGQVSPTVSSLSTKNDPSSYVYDNIPVNGSNSTGEGSNTKTSPDMTGQDMDSGETFGSSVAYVDYHSSEREPSKIPLWIWLMSFLLLAAWVGSAFVLKPWRTISK